MQIYRMRRTQDSPTAKAPGETTNLLKKGKLK